MKTGKMISDDIKGQIVEHVKKLERKSLEEL